MGLSGAVVAAGIAVVQCYSGGGGGRRRRRPNKKNLLKAGGRASV